MISLHHLEVNGQRLIGLKFDPDKVMQALVKSLPNAKRYSKRQMDCVPNNNDNFDKLINTFKRQVLTTIYPSIMGT